VSVLELRRLLPTAHMRIGHLQDSCGQQVPSAFHLEVCGGCSDWFVSIRGLLRWLGRWPECMGCSHMWWAICTAVWGLHSLVGL
jgi:hypothetical protein